MMLSLYRDREVIAECSLGTLTVAGEVFATIERPWIPITDAPCGKKGVSCVPPGIYKLAPHNSEAHPNTWALVNPDLWVYHWDQDVPPPERGLARTLVLIHVANYAAELRGCIAPGRGRSVDPVGRRMVTRSRDAMSMILQLLPYGQAHTLEIT